jgi:hypothetical protein
MRRKEEGRGGKREESEKVIPLCDLERWVAMATFARFNAEDCSRTNRNVLL